MIDAHRDFVILTCREAYHVVTRSTDLVNQYTLNALSHV